MTRDAIFWPLIAQVTLTTAIWLRMYFARVGEMRTRRIHPQSVATSRLAAGALEDVAPADNFRNLFEVPVLFYAIGCVLAIADAVTALQVSLAWTFVGLRALHSLIHVTYNRVLHRFWVYVLSTLCVLAMWLVFALRLALGDP